MDTLLVWFLYLSGIVIKFFEVINKGCLELYKRFKTNVLNGKLVYYAVYDTYNHSYRVIYNYDNPLSVLWCFFGPDSAFPVREIESAFKKDLVVVCQYVKDYKETHAVYDSYGYKNREGLVHPTKFLYVQMETHDLTHVFQLFSESLALQNKISACDCARILYMYHTGCFAPRQFVLKTMIDDDKYVETVYKENDPLVI